MSTAIGLETLRFEFPGSKTLPAFAPVLVGVIGSGNLEILQEDVGGKKCSFEVQTSARGFGQIWEAVLGDFQMRHDLSGVQVTIHDMGATPAVVSLRLSQAAAELA